jgi:hypothetical protein
MPARVVEDDNLGLPTALCCISVLSLARHSEAALLAGCIPKKVGCAASGGLRPASCSADSIQLQVCLHTRQVRSAGRQGPAGCWPVAEPVAGCSVTKCKNRAGHTSCVNSTLGNTSRQYEL